ncbi:long-chain fatty acid--CoA ligase [Tardiphaga sp.]|uniref:AMP-dependent synthetase/ligase n=1 Tax=Tardiphaga sp. TaxID=1926292 RepID=UPI00352BB48B
MINAGIAQVNRGGVVDAWPATLVAALAENAERAADRIAIREREFGIWRERNWKQVLDEVLAIAAGLEDIGLARGATVTVIGDNRANLYVAMLAANVLGAAPAPVFADVPPDELFLYTRHGEPTIAFAEDQEQVDKLLKLRERIGRPVHIIYDDPRGLNAYRESGLMAFGTLMESGRARLARTMGLSTELLGRTCADDIAVLLHSSGTTGQPKGVVVRQRHISAAVHTGAKGDFFAEGGECFGYLPMAWIGDFVFTLSSTVFLRGTINIPERQETILQDLRATAPTMYLAAPRAWDNMLTRIQVGMADSTPLKRKLFDYFMPRAVEIERRRLSGATPTIRERLLLMVGEVLMFGPIKDFIGLSRATRAYTGGEALGEDTFLFFRALGVNLKQFYGQTETCAITAAQPDGEVRLDTVGRPLPGVELKISEQGEVLVRSGSVIDGYIGDDEASAKTFIDGWLRTGDAGEIGGDGQLRVLGRVSEVVRTAAGDQYLPNYIENRIKFSSFVRNVAVTGSGQPFLGAIVCIDFEAVGHWAERQGISYTSYADLSQKPEVYALIGKVLQDISAQLSGPLAIRRFVNLHKDFDADDGEITRTRKLRRNVIEDRYAPLIVAIYEGRPSVVFEASIVYESGEKGIIRRDLQVMDVGGSWT